MIGRVKLAIRGFWIVDTGFVVPMYFALFRIR
jgi:hypothetical protein